MAKPLSDNELREALKLEQEDADFLKALSRNPNPPRGAFATLGAMKERIAASHPKLVKDAQPDAAPIVIVIEDGEVTATTRKAGDIAPPADETA